MSRRPFLLRLRSRMSSNERLALLLAALALLVGYARQLGVAVFAVVPEPVAAAFSTVGSMLSAGAVVFAVAAFRERPGRTSQAR